MTLWAIGTSATPYLMKVMIDGVMEFEGDKSDLLSHILWPTIWYIAIFELININYRIYDYFLLKTMPRLQSDIRISMFNYTQNHSYNYFKNNLSGSLVTKISDMAKGAEAIITLMIDPIFAHLAVLVIAGATMYLVDPIFMIILLVWATIFIAITYKLSLKSQEYSKKLSKARSVWMGKLVDVLTNINNVQLFARKKFERKYLKKFLKDDVRKSEALELYVLKIRIFQGSASSILMAMMVLLLVHMLSRDLISIGDFAFVLSLSVTVVRAIWFLANQLVKFSKEIGICSFALSVINQPHEIVNKEDAKWLKVTDGEIIFDNVSFSYDVDEISVFQNNSITIKPGEKVGLVGKSGAGKSTFINLLLRNYEVDGGQITIDGHSLTDVVYDSIRKNISVIPQDIILFHRDVMENIRYGRLSASDEEVVQAAKYASCHDFIMDMDAGYQTMVGERGIRLSGGQRQRIAIARAILRNAPILIMDEATSALDSIIEHKIQKSLHKLMEGKTSIVIAHRLSTLMNMDRILVFKDGKIIEDGSHKELLKISGYYAKMWHMQINHNPEEK